MGRLMDGWTDGRTEEQGGMSCYAGESAGP